MTVEDIANSSLSTLAADMSTTDVTVQLQPADASKFPAAGNYRLVVISGGVPEVMLVTAGQGTANLTVTRAYETGNGLSNAAAHTTGDLVGATLTRGGLRNMVPVKIAEKSVSVTAANIDFTALSQDFRHLEIRYSLKCSAVAVFPDVLLQFNGDAGNNYIWDHMSSSNASSAVTHVFQATASSIVIGGCEWVATNGNLFAAGRAVVYEYKNTLNKWKQVLHDASSHLDNSGQATTGPGAGVWKSLAAINRIVLTPSSGVFTAGSYVEINGIP